MANDIKLQEGHPVDSHLRPLKVGGELTAIETAQQEARINGDLTVTGRIPIVKTNRITTGASYDPNDLYADVRGDIYLKPSGEQVYVGSFTDPAITLDGGGAGTTFITLKSVLDTGDYMKLSTTTHGATTLATVDDNAAVAHLNIEADGHVEFDGCAAGFQQIAETFSDDSIIGSGGTHDTHIDFRAGNKIYLLMTNDVVNMNLIFPAVSGNFLLQLRYDGDHDITNWKVYESDASAADGSATVFWPGGTAPATTASGKDVFSFFWDVTNEFCYGVASLDFQVPS